MQREIKFRAWDSKSQRMYYQGEPDLEDIQSFFHHYNDNDVLMQFTGLTDKNGNEVYEGDVLFLKEGHNSWRTHVVFTERGWHRQYDYPVGEIIGNIYENPKIFKKNETP
ncbi:YopX family protein [Bergeyella zoohelcum]|uniref:YopX family protein n=1 Tax=Bergeyella zoohelcum TaxID=1015 RepID=UPI00373632DB